MGKVIKLLKKIRSQTPMALMERFKHLVGAQAIRNYMASKPNNDLDIEVRLTEEEIMKRMLSRAPILQSIIKDKEDDNNI